MAHRGIEASSPGKRSMAHFFQGKYDHDHDDLAGNKTNQIEITKSSANNGHLLTELRMQQRRARIPLIKRPLNCMESHVLRLRAYYWIMQNTFS